ncbi:hypothetical protein ACFLV5_00650 [Chloroflexota bacterium]
MTMSQGFLSSADSSALSVQEINATEGEIKRTALTMVSAANLSWADLLRVRLENSGQTKLASFSKWDVIVEYHDESGTYYTKWLPYVEGTLGDNQWQKKVIYLNGSPEVFEPAILNHGEEMVILAKLSPLPGTGTAGNAIISSPNGIRDSSSFSSLGYTLLVPHSENTTIARTAYYHLREGAFADGSAMTETTDLFDTDEADRKMMYDETQPSRPARHVFSLLGISEIPASTWTVYYRCRTWEINQIQDGDVNFDIDILIRKLDGTVRATIATGVADAYLASGEEETWLTKSGTYDFPGYTVVDESDYLEIVYYGETDASGPQEDPGYMQIRIDDDTLPEADQTRIVS